MLCELYFPLTVHLIYQLAYCGVEGNHRLIGGRKRGVIRFTTILYKVRVELSLLPRRQKSAWVAAHIGELLANV